MIIHDIEHPNNSFIHTGDFISVDDILLIDENFKIYRNNEEVEVDLDLEWPIARIISEDTFLLVDSRSVRDNKDNAWIIKNDGSITKSFFLDAVVDIQIVNSRIIGAYSKCSLNMTRFTTSVYVNISEEKVKEMQEMKYLCEEGVAIFDLEGNCLYKYMSDVKDEDYIFFMEIESILRKDNEIVYLLAHAASFLILELNLTTFLIRKVTEFNIEEYFPRSIALKDDSLYFLATKYQEIEEGNLQNMRSHMFKLNKDQSIQKVGTSIFSGRSQGKNDGSFFIPSHYGAKDQKQYSCHVKI